MSATSMFGFNSVGSGPNHLGSAHSAREAVIDETRGVVGPHSAVADRTAPQPRSSHVNVLRSSRVLKGWCA